MRHCNTSYILPLLAAILSFTSCETEIDLPYRSVEPLYVIEGRVTNETTEVVITRTRDMEDKLPEDSLSRAFVQISTNDGTTETLHYGPDGCYRPANPFTGTPGTEYTLSVMLDGRTYTSSSYMNKGTQITGIRFRWLEVMNNARLFCSVTLTDDPDEANYYAYWMRRNGENYRWNVTTDKGYEGDILPIDIGCMTRDEAEENDEEDRDDILYDGDEIEVEVRVIDRRTYDYLYSIVLSESTAANPAENFTGGCLGYFSAYSTVRAKTVYTAE